MWPSEKKIWRPLLYMLKIDMRPIHKWSPLTIKSAEVLRVRVILYDIVGNTWYEQSNILNTWVTQFWNKRSGEGLKSSLWKTRILYQKYFHIGKVKHCYSREKTDSVLAVFLKFHNYKTMLFYLLPLTKHQNIWRILRKSKTHLQTGNVWMLQLWESLHFPLEIL